MKEDGRTHFNEKLFDPDKGDEYPSELKLIEWDLVEENYENNLEKENNNNDDIHELRVVKAHDEHNENHSMIMINDKKGSW